MNKKIYGTWMVSGSVFSSQIIAESNLDFGVVDLEHGHFNKNEIPIIIKLLQSKGKIACIRTSSHSRSEILNCLDAGPEMIFIPSVNTVEEVKDINKSCLFHPLGLRGSSGCTPANSFSKLDFTQFKKDVNSHLVIGYMIETKEGLDNLIDMAKFMHDKSIVYFGTYDLAESYGINDPFSEELIIKLKKVISNINSLNKNIQFGMVASGYGNDVIPNEISFIPLFGDAGLYLRGLNETLKKYKSN